MKTKVLLGLALIFSVCFGNVKAAEPTVDPFSYPSHGEYTFTNNWIYSHGLGNYQSVMNPIEGALQLSVAQGTVRNMAYWNGKLVFGSRNGWNGETSTGDLGIIVMDAATGAFEKELILNVPGFAGVNPCNTICVDNAGNVLVCNISTATQFQVWSIDMETGDGTKVLDVSNNEILGAERFDAIGVWGDVTTNGSIWGMIGASSSAGLDHLFRWRIVDGVAPEDPDLIIVDFSNGFNGVANMGTAPVVFPVDEDLAYIYGTSVLPTLIAVTGDPDEGYTAVAVDGFFALDGTPGLVNNIDDVTDPGNPLVLEVSTLNGFTRFQIGDEYFFALSMSRHANYVTGEYPTTPNQAWRLYKFKNEDMLIREAEVLWSFPRDGMAQGVFGTSNANNFLFGPIHSVVDGDKANIYVYSGEWGVASYEFDTKGNTGIKYPKVAGITVYAADKAVKFSEAVASAQIFGLTGQLIAKASNTASVAITLPGVYVVKATASNGETVISKVIVK